MAETSSERLPGERVVSRTAEGMNNRDAGRAADCVEDYEAARRAAALFDQSDRGKVELRGKDAARVVHNFCTNDVLHLKPGDGCEAFFTSPQARVVAHGWIYRLDDPREALVWLDLAPGKAAALVQHLDRYLISERVEMRNVSTEFAQFHLAGPYADEVLKRRLGQDLPPLGELQHVQGALGAIARAQIRRHDALGLPGYDLLVPQGEATSAREVLVGAGARPAGPGSFEILRVEAGTPLDGIDLDESNLPQEVGRTDRAISFTKGCYLGQETVFRIRTHGHVNRRLLGLRLTGSACVDRGTPIYRADQEVGRTTSCVISPGLGVIALAYLRRGSEEPGTQVLIDENAGRRAGVVTGLPFPGAGSPNP